MLLTVVNFNIYRQTCQFTYFCDYTYKNGGRNLQIPSPVIIRKLYPYAAVAAYQIATQIIHDIIDRLNIAAGRRSLAVVLRVLSAKAQSMAVGYRWVQTGLQLHLG